MSTFFFPIVTKCMLPITHMVGIREDGLQMEMKIYHIETFEESQKQNPIVIENQNECLTHINAFMTIRFKSHIVPAFSENEEWSIKLISAQNAPANCVQITISMQKPPTEHKTTTEKASPVPITDQRVVEIDDEPIVPRKDKGIKFYTTSNNTK